MDTENTDELLLKRFSRELEALDHIDETEFARLTDNEYKDILYLAKKLTLVDFSTASKVKEDLKKKLMSMLDSNMGQQSELSAEELDHVAGGIKKDQDYPFPDIN